MTVLAVALVLAFDGALSFVEVPKMIRGKQFKELFLYSVLLLTGSAVMILRNFNIKMPNPTDLILWIYAPLSGLMKQLLS